ncbi:MAG: PQQ-binding-like beta-propeller repeat protein [Phycisphaerae bacterium]
MMQTRLSRMIVVMSVLGFTGVGAAQYRQWGGPKQDFKCKTKGLAANWPPEGPPKLWSRDLGEGYSGILAEKGLLYTMYRGDEREVVIALDAKTGETIWEHPYDAPISEKHQRTFNAGPRGTPLLSGKRLYAIGCTGKMHCLSAETGKVYWSRDLWKEFGGTFLMHGYASSPFAYKKTVIVMVGGEGHSLIALDKKTGDVVWKKQDYKNSYSTPKLIQVDGEEQLLCYMAQELVGVNPRNGERLWSYEIGNQFNQNITLPIWGKDNILFLTSEVAGSRGLKLTREGKQTIVEELWSNRKVRIHHSNAIRVGDYAYTSSGGMGRPGLFWAVDVRTGKVAWRERGFDKATCLYADGRFIILDENGHLGLATATPEFFEIHAKVPMLEPKEASKTWTAPTLAGKTLYLRDSRKIMALDLSTRT